MTQKHINIANVKFGNDLPFALIAGPCQMESKQHAIDMVGAIKEITDKLSISLIYKSSFDKANRTSLKGVRGIGIDKALPIFTEIKQQFNCPVITDVHTEEQCEIAGQVMDALQIPAFLCRQTDLLIAAAKTGKAINVKKGQFLAPWDMENVVKKITESGNDNVLITDRGTSFGYNNLVTDVRGFPIMAKTGYPVIIDATHSTQQPGGQGQSSGGQRQFMPIIAGAALSTGIAGVFAEVHQDPDNAPSDGPCMIKLQELEKILTRLKAIDEVAKQHKVEGI